VAGPAIVAVRAAGNITTAASSTIITLSGSQTVGNHLICLVALGSQAGGLSSVSGSGNSFTVRQNIAGTLSTSGYAFADCKIGSSMTQITLNFSAAIKASWYIVEVSGLDPTSWYDAVSVSKTGAAASSSLSTNPVTAAAANEVIFGLWSAGAWASGSAGSSFASVGPTLNLAPDRFAVYDLTGNAGSNTPTATMSGANAYSGGAIAYKPIAAITYNLTPSGGIVLGGTRTSARTFAVSPSGGIRLGGSVVTTFVGPNVVSAPVASGGTTVGQTLSCTTGSWTSQP